MEDGCCFFRSSQSFFAFRLCHCLLKGKKYTKCFPDRGIHSRYTTREYTEFINEALYTLGISTVRPTETISPDSELLSQKSLFNLLKQRIRNGQLQILIEINLGYFCIDRHVAQQLDVAPDQDFEYMLLPVW